jgi:hypothetical protein
MFDKFLKQGHQKTKKSQEPRDFFLGILLTKSPPKTLQILEEGDFVQ